MFVFILMWLPTVNIVSFILTFDKAKENASKFFEKSVDKCFERWYYVSVVSCG